MINLSVHAEFLRREAADPFTGASLPAALIVGGVLAAVLIGTTFGTPQSRSIEAVAAEALADSPRRAANPAIAIMKVRR